MNTQPHPHIPSHPIDRWINLETRRQFFGRQAKGLAATALAALTAEQACTAPRNSVGGTLGHGHFPARAKRVIWLFMAGAPSQLDTLDYKPTMVDWYNKDLPESVRQGQRLTTMTASQSRFPIAPTMFKFPQNDYTKLFIGAKRQGENTVISSASSYDSFLTSNAKRNAGRRHRC